MQERNHNWNLFDKLSQKLPVCKNIVNTDAGKGDILTASEQYQRQQQNSAGRHQTQS